MLGKTKNKEVTTKIFLGEEFEIPYRFTGTKRCLATSLKSNAKFLLRSPKTNSVGMDSINLPVSIKFRGKQTAI